MDESLNTILDNLVGLICATEHKELIQSFSKLFRELLYSEYKDIFLEKLKKEAITENENLRKKIVYILISNSWDKDVGEALISLLNRDERICLPLYKIPSHINFPFQMTQYYKNIFIEKFDYLKSQMDDDRIKNACRTFINLVGAIFFQGFIPAALRN